jgi:uncharacterized SAM-binding protein YcdF (DUF218 family)
MLYRRLFKYALIFACLLCLIAAIQTSAAIYFSQSKTKLEPADLVVVFPGDSKRIKAGIEIVRDGLAPHFMVISTTDTHLRKLLTKNGVPATVNVLPGGKSRSTFEDVYQTAKTIKENQLSSVIVVTSSYHLPRALFLLAAHLKITGQDVRIQGFPVKEAQQSNKKLQQYGNEVIKFWGSVVEMTGYYFTDQLVLDAPNSRKIQMILKKNLLW